MLFDIKQIFEDFKKGKKREEKINRVCILKRLQ